MGANDISKYQGRNATVDYSKSARCLAHFDPSPRLVHAANADRPLQLQRREGESTSSQGARPTRSLDGYPEAQGEGRALG